MEAKPPCQRADWTLAIRPMTAIPNSPGHLLIQQNTRRLSSRQDSTGVSIHDTESGSTPSSDLRHIYLYYSPPPFFFFFLNRTQSYIMSLCSVCEAEFICDCQKHGNLQYEVWLLCHHVPLQIAMLTLSFEQEEVKPLMLNPWGLRAKGQAAVSAFARGNSSMFWFGRRRIYINLHQIRNMGNKYVSQNLLIGIISQIVAS